MKKNNQKKGKYLLGLLVGVVALGIGYAAISNVTLSIAGTATATGTKNDADFTVRFIKTDDTVNEVPAVAEIPAKDRVKYTVVNGNKELAASATIKNDETAEFTVTNMEAGNEVVFTYYIANLSNGLGADITPSISTSENSNFTVEVTPTIGETFHLNENEVQEVTVRVTCEEQSALEKTETFSISFKADPTE